MSEFSLINQYFSQLGYRRAEVVLGVGDDAALTQVPNDRLLVTTTDTLNEGIHFLPQTAPELVAEKALMVNLSDLASMGAEPVWISLALSIPEPDEEWVSIFSQRLHQLCSAQRVSLIGGDTTRGPLAITLCAQGFVPPQQVMCRHKAQTGELLLVTGTIGDAALGLAQLQHSFALTSGAQYAIARYHQPTARVAFGQALAQYSNCCIDISDGLLSDLGHLLKASQCGAQIQVEQLPIAPVYAHAQHTDIYPFALAGGDDYELCFTLPAEHLVIVQQLAEQHDVPVTVVGQITAQQGLDLRLQGQPFEIGACGFDHFAK